MISSAEGKLSKIALKNMKLCWETRTLFKTSHLWIRPSIRCQDIDSKFLSVVWLQVFKTCWRLKWRLIKDFNKKQRLCEVYFNAVEELVVLGFLHVMEISFIWLSRNRQLEKHQLENASWKSPVGYNQLENHQLDITSLRITSWKMPVGKSPVGKSPVGNRHLGKIASWIKIASWD